MVQTNNLGITLVEQSQSQKEVTVNEALVAIDAVINAGAIDKDLATPPGSPSEGDTYIIATSATDDWATHDNEVAYYNQGEWLFIIPKEGLTFWVNDEDKEYTWDGAAWVGSGAADLNGLEDVEITSAAQYELLQHNGTDFVNIADIDNLGRLGVNTTSDATNKFAVKSDAVLFVTDTGDSQIKVSKTSSTDTASYLFQTNFSGRAEFGLVGDDDFQLKVSPDGSTFHQSFVIDKDTGDVEFKQNVTGIDLADMGDTNISGPANGEILKYNGTNWVNETVSGATSSLDSLDDVEITTPADSDFLVYDGTDWVNEVPATARTSMGAAASATTMTAGDGLSGGGDLSTNRTFNVDISGQTADASPDGAADYVLTYDDSAAGLKKVLLDDLPGVAVSQIDFISGVMETPDDKDYTLVLDIPYAIIITETATQSASGTCTATFKINSTALGGTANSVSGFEQKQAHASDNAASEGDNIVLTISGNSSCADMAFRIKFTRTLA